MPAFTDTEEKLLRSFFTNLDKDVFGLLLPQEVAGALFSRYSRSTKSLRRTFLDEFLGNPDLHLQDIVKPRETGGLGDTTALTKAREFYDRVLVGYGDDSVAQLGGAHLACENISNVMAKILEDARIGIAPLEKSTRYVRFDKKDEKGDYLFYKEQKILASPYGKDYLSLMTLLFETYSRQLDPMMTSVESSLPITEVEFKHPRTGDPVRYRDIKDDEKMRTWSETAYRSTVRAHACDVLRSYLPAATKTNVGLFGVGQAFEYLLTKLYSHDLAEAQALAPAMHEELRMLIPSFVKRAKVSNYLVETRQKVLRATQELVGSVAVHPSSSVTLVDYDPEAEEKLLATILYPHSRHSLSQLRSHVRGMSFDTRKRVIAEYLAGRKNRRDKPGRALENMSYTFDFLGNLGMYRDLQRHRMLTQERQNFTVEHGYDLPQEIAGWGFKDEFTRCMEEAARLYHKIAGDLPLEAQYVVPFAYRIRWYMTLNLREAFHIAELRTMPQGHPDYRCLIQEMFRQITAVHPAVAYYATFIDWGSYRLGRLTSEVRTEYKRSLLSERG